MGPRSSFLGLRLRNSPSEIMNEGFETGANLIGVSPRPRGFESIPIDRHRKKGAFFFKHWPG